MEGSGWDVAVGDEVAFRDLGLWRTGKGNVNPCAVGEVVWNGFVCFWVNLFGYLCFSLRKCFMFM